MVATKVNDDVWNGISGVSSDEERCFYEESGGVFCYDKVRVLRGSMCEHPDLGVVRPGDRDAYSYKGEVVTTVVSATDCEKYLVDLLSLTPIEVASGWHLLQNNGKYKPVYVYNTAGRAYREGANPDSLSVRGIGESGLVEADGGTFSFVDDSPLRSVMGLGALWMYHLSDERASYTEACKKVFQEGFTGYPIGYQMLLSREEGSSVADLFFLSDRVAEVEVTDGNLNTNITWLSPLYQRVLEEDLL